jgi:O-antigen ligase
VLGAVPGMIAVALALGGDAKRVLLGIILIGTVGFWLWIGYSGNRYSEDDDDSAATRPVLWAASARIALDNPVLGVGHNKFLELSPEYASSISRSVRENQDAVGALGNTQPHNDFLNVWLSFGTMAFAVFVALFVLIGRAFLEGIRRAPDPVLKGIGAGGLGALVAFAANSAFHNFFDSTLTLWLLGGFAIALVKVAVIEERVRRKVVRR